jgi:hypothetical protein
MNKNTTSMPSSTVNNKNRRNLRIATGVVLVLVLALTLYFILWPIKQKNNEANTNTGGSQAVEVTDDANTLKGTLPNGKTITYPNTEGNRNISWSSSEKGANYVSLSHKGIEKFLSTVDPTVITKLCGTNGELARKDDIVVATMSTLSRLVEYSVDDNCLDELATLRNTDVKSRTEARALVKVVDADIQEFYKKVIIK